jgi:hypothetical protein
MSKEDPPMAMRHDDQPGDNDRKSHISNIKQRLAEMSRGQKVTGGIEALPLEEQEPFGVV